MKRKILKDYEKINKLIKNHDLLDLSEKDILVYILENYRIGVSNLVKMFNVSEGVLINRIDEYHLKYLLPNKEDIIKIQKQYIIQSEITERGISWQRREI